MRFWMLAATTALTTKVAGLSGALMRLSRWKWAGAGDGAVPPIRLIGCAPEHLQASVSEFFGHLVAGGLRGTGLGRGRWIAESTVGDARRLGEVDRVPPSVDGSVEHESRRGPDGPPVRPPLARHARTVLALVGSTTRACAFGAGRLVSVDGGGWWSCSSASRAVTGERSTRRVIVPRLASRAEF